MTPWSIFGGSGDLLRKFQSEFVDVEIFEIKHIMSHSFTRYTKHDIRNFAPAILNISLDISVYRVSGQILLAQNLRAWQDSNLRPSDSKSDALIH